MNHRFRAPQDPQGLVQQHWTHPRQAEVQETSAPLGGAGARRKSHSESTYEAPSPAGSAKFCNPNCVEWPQNVEGGSAQEVRGPELTTGGPSGDEHEPARSEEVKSRCVFIHFLFHSSGASPPRSRVERNREQPFGVPSQGRAPPTPSEPSGQVAFSHPSPEIPPGPAIVPCAHCPAGPRGKARVWRRPRGDFPRVSSAPAPRQPPPGAPGHAGPRRGGGGGRGPGAGGSRALAWPRRAPPHTRRRRGENEVAQARGSAGRALTRPALVASVACRGALSCLRGQSQPVVAFRPRGPATRKATRRAAPSCVACWRGEGGARGGIPGDTEAGAAEERAGNPRG